MTRRTVIRQCYRLRRVTLGLTQVQIELKAKLPKGRYWWIENGYRDPTPAERKRLARVLKVDAEDLPTLCPNAKGCAA